MLANIFTIFYMRAPTLGANGEVEGVVNEEAGGRLFRELVIMIVEQRASESELLTRVQQSGMEVFGRDLNEEDAREVLRPVYGVVAIVERLARGGFTEMDEDEPRDRSQTERDDRSTLDKIRFAIGGVTLALRFVAMRSCPGLVNIVGGKYTSEIDGKRLSLTEVMDSLGGMDGLSSGVVHRIEAIRIMRMDDSEALLSDEDMEFLRKILFLVNGLRIPDSMFCDFGQGILRDMRQFVGDYERAKAQR